MLPTAADPACSQVEEGLSVTSAADNDRSLAQDGDKRPLRSTTEVTHLRRIESLLVVPTSAINLAEKTDVETALGVLGTEKLRATSAEGTGGVTVKSYTN